MHIYEYLFTAIIIVTMLLASSTMIGTLSGPSRSVSEKEQLKVAAQKIMTQILLDPGDPSDWGSNVDIDESDLKTFGLAKHSETTREAYVLDPDKVYRLNDALLLLNNTCSLYISPYRAINLLNLGYEYGFTLEIFPALNVSIAPKDSGKYEVSVSSDYGRLPIVGADVTARMYYYDASSQKIASRDEDFITGLTGYDGKCALNFNETSEMKVLILVIDYYGVRVVKVFPAGLNVKRAHLIGEHLFLSEDEDISNNAIQIIVTRKAGRYVIENVTSILNIVPPGKFDLTSPEKFDLPSTVAVLAVSEDGTRLIFTSSEVNLAYSSIPGVWSFPFAYSVERSVVIGGSAYIVRLYLWRMSW